MILSVEILLTFNAQLKANDHYQIYKVHIVLFKEMIALHIEIWNIKRENMKAFTTKLTFHFLKFDGYQHPYSFPK